MQLGQLSVAGGFGLLGATIIVNTASLPPVAHIEFGPALFPTIVGWVMIALSGLAAFDALRSPAVETGADEDEPSEPLDHHRIILFAAFGAAPLIYVALAPILGFLLTMPLIVGGLAFVASGKPGRSILLGLGLTALLHIVFYQVLRVTLPWGVLTDYAGVLTWR
ncbi:tripartite tricarboxylate transporter TctB family protein [Devosia ginsengisoli]|uniref:Tripartite tricarboxylate transporter TctB family protein n=1 Tax=Devosia ginsengisoli TaxID=400770 RepID=A0A5B8LTB3_9HYPH|nr:tripartite tricarboxylate transporter TctB family protein [Devosia ginsengisoli]QDZ11453.1 tripartite tricarboxylate transporter TctB family protein [Devosia ginsengisoli]